MDMTSDPTALSSLTQLPMLAVLQMLPLAGALVVAALRRTRFVFWAGLIVALAELALAILLYQRLDVSSGQLQFVEQVPLVGPLVYHAGVDGLGVLFVLLTGLLGVLVIAYGRIRGLEPTGLFQILVLVVQAALMSQFVTVDLLWFVVLSVIEFAVVGYLLWRWGVSLEKDRMLMLFYQFMGTGLILLLLGAALLAGHYASATGSGWSFDLTRLTTVAVDPALQTIAFFLLFYGLAIRIPLFPFHGWLPTLALHGNVAVAPTLLLGLKTGIYGLLRFVFPLVPDAVIQWHQFVVAFAVTGVFYAAALAMLQSGMRRLLAYAVVSHTSILVIGLFSLHSLAFQGGIILAVNFGLAISALAMMTGLVYLRTRTTNLDKLGGLFDRIPLIGVTFLIGGFSIIGMPGTPGFDAAHLILEASIARFGGLLTIAAALGNVAAAGFLLWAFQRAFLAPHSEKSTVSEVARTTVPERLLAASLVLILLGSGFYSEPWLELVEAPMNRLGELYELRLHGGETEVHP